MHYQLEAAQKTELQSLKKLHNVPFKSKGGLPLINMQYHKKDKLGKRLKSFCHIRVLKDPLLVTDLCLISPTTISKS